MSIGLKLWLSGFFAGFGIAWIVLKLMGAV